MNKVIIVGNVTADVELQRAKKVDYARFSVAVNRYDGEADFIPVITFGEQAKNCAKYLKKGKKVAVCGALQIETYETKHGDKALSPSILAQTVEFLSPATKE